jgi:L-lactate dehydrogenase complex protein LldG
MSTANDVMDRVRRALGRQETLPQAPAAPRIPQPIVRLAHSELGLDKLFMKQAQASNMSVQAVHLEQLSGKLAELLHRCLCHRIALPRSDLLERLALRPYLAQCGFEVLVWDQMKLDDLYSCDAGVTDVYCAVAETGSLVIRPSQSHGRGLSLIPPVHVAIVEPRNLVPDLVDLFAKLSGDGLGSNVTIITGPSKTADIEMNLITGMHGPGKVEVFVLQ